MHSAAYHIPQMVEQHKNLKEFSGQGTLFFVVEILECITSPYFSSNKELVMLIFKLAGVEKNNDDALKIMRRKSNQTDDPAELLRTEHRIRAQKHRERKPRQYTKKNTEYWENKIKTNRRLCKQVSYDKPPEVIPSEEVLITTEPPPHQNKRGKRKHPLCNSKSKEKGQAKRAKKP